jgi:hypothetical protein
MSIDFSMKQSLIEAGLVDPASGEFTSAPNFGEPVVGDEPRSPLSNEDEPAPAPEPQPNQKPASVPGTTEVPSAPEGEPGVEKADQGTPVPPQQNPARLGDEADPVRQEYEQSVNTMRNQAQMAYLYGQTLTDQEGHRVFSDQQLTQMIGQNLQLAEQQAYLQGVMRRMEPVAKRAAAEKIAKEHGVELEDILNEGSPVAMVARAKTIADLTRDGRFQRRKESGADVAEGSRNFNNAIPEGLEKLTPHQKIYAGLARGDR